MWPKTTFILIACAGIAILFFFDRTYNSDWEKSRQMELLSTDRICRTRLENAINSRLNAVDAVASLFMLHPETTSEAFSYFSKLLMKSNPPIRALQYADSQTRITYVYPLEGNEITFKKPLHLLADSARSQFVKKAISQKTCSVQGPFMLRQGGMGVVARLPIFRSEEFLGLAIGVYDIPILLKEAFWGIDLDRFVVQLSDANGKVFWGPETIADDFIEGSVFVADATWQMRLKWTDSAANPPFLYRFLIWFLGGGFLLSSLWVLQLFQEKTKSLKQIVEERTRDLTETNQKLVNVIGRNKVTEESLRESERKYRLITEHANDIIWTLNLELRFTYVSPSVFRIRGYTPEEGMNQSLEEILTPDSLKYAVGVFAETMEKEAGGEKRLEPTIMELEHFCKNGTTLWMEVSMSFLRDRNGEPTGVIGVSRDIDDRKRAEKALTESEKKYRLLAENANDVIWTMDLSFHTTYISPSIERLRGYTPEEVLRQTLSEILTPASMELAATVFTTELALEKKGARNYLNTVLELEFLCKNGSTVLLESSVSPMKDEMGDVIGMFGISRDVTEQRIIEQQLLRSEKLASLGDMVAGVSHEISTPLGASLLSASYLQDTTDEFTEMIWTGKLQLPDVKKYAERIAKASAMIVSNLERSSELLNSFKNVAVDQLVKEKREFAIKKNMEETLNSLKPKYKNTSHTIILQCPEDLTIHHYPGTFSQITTNLVMNSLIHGFDGIEKGEIRITIEKQGDNLFLIFQDSGRGMDAATQKKIYDPFFTTKRNRGGTGLGLHIVHNLVCQTLLGQITCVSSPGKGTVFQIKIPCHGTT